MARYKALVAGASGVVGRRLAEYLAHQGDWDVIGLSRRTVAGAPYGTMAVDLTDPRDCREKLAGLTATTCCHTFRATGITAFLENGGTIENAQAIAAHESPRTTKLYDRTSDEITLDEVERIVL